MSGENPLGIGSWLVYAIYHSPLTEEYVCSENNVDAERRSFAKTGVKIPR